MIREYVGVEVKFKIHCSTLQFGVMVRFVQQGGDGFPSYTSTKNMKTCERGGSARLHREAPEGLFHHMVQLRPQLLVFCAFLVVGKQTRACSNRPDLHPKKNQDASHFSFISVTAEQQHSTPNSAHFSETVQ